MDVIRSVLYNKVNEIIPEHFKSKIDTSSLTRMINLECNHLLTNYNNHIKMNFISIMNNFINIIFKNQYINNNVNNNLSKEVKRLQLKEFKKQLMDGICYDNLIRLYSDNEFISLFVRSYYNMIYPKDLLIKLNNNNFEEILKMELDIEPHKNITYMYRMCKELQNLNYKSLQLLPMRTRMIPAHVPFDTAAII